MEVQMIILYYITEESFWNYSIYDLCQHELALSDHIHNVFVKRFFDIS